MQEEEQRCAREALQYVRELRLNGDTAGAVLAAEEALGHLVDGGQMPPHVFAELYVELFAERASALEELAESLSHERQRPRGQRRLSRPRLLGHGRVRTLARGVLFAALAAIAGWVAGGVTTAWAHAGQWGVMSGVVVTALIAAAFLASERHRRQ